MAGWMWASEDPQNIGAQMLTPVDRSMLEQHMSKYQL